MSDHPWPGSRHWVILWYPNWVILESWGLTYFCSVILMLRPLNLFLLPISFLSASSPPSMVNPFQDVFGAVVGRRCRWCAAMMRGIPNEPAWSYLEFPIVEVFGSASNVNRKSRRWLSFDLMLTKCIGYLVTKFRSGRWHPAFSSFPWPWIHVQDVPDTDVLSFGQCHQLLNK